MDLDKLHRDYAPILHYAAGERFYPMAVEDWLSYCALYRRGEARPQVQSGRLTPDALVGLTRRNGGDMFVRSVDRGPLEGRDVAAQWSDDTLALVARLGQMGPAT